MKRINIDTIDKNNSFFRFDVRKEEYIDKFGFPAARGQNSINAEENEKVFFSKGIKGILDLIDVWIIWRINKDHYQTEFWDKEFLEEKYINDYEKLEITFKNMQIWLSERKYYLVKLEENIDYKENDIDEAKLSVIKDKNNGKLKRYLYAKEMYKGKTENFDNLKMESWNMHTKIGQGISSDKISMIVTPNKEEDALSIINYLYYNYQNKNEFRILGLFLEYTKDKNNNHKK